MNYDFNKTIIRAYDIRGIISETLHVKDAYFLGRKFAEEIFERHKSKRIVVGYDGRLSSPILEKELLLGLKEGGAKVIKIGLCPSPMLYFASKSLDSDGAIMITGSHNPSNYNGFKILDREQSFYGKDIEKLAERKIIKKKQNGTINDFNVKELYLKALTKDLKFINDNLRIVWDPGNGASCDIIKSLKNIIPGKHFIINDKVDGTFPAHHPDPTIEKNLIMLKKSVKKLKADLGIAFDGDGDRIGVIDNKLNSISGDQLLLIFAEEVLEENPGATIISDVKASDLIFSIIKKKGGNAIMWKTGHSFIKSKMTETGALLAGEMSGHIFFADRYYGYDDAIYASLRLLEIISKKKYSLNLSKIFLNSISTPELKIDCNDNTKFTLIAKCKNIVKKKYKNFSLVDGVRVGKKEGWWLLRASNTQPALTVRCESNSKENIKKMISEIENILSLAGFKTKIKI